MHIPWGDLELFLAVAEARSFSGAARKLGIEQPTVSRRFQALEERVGEPLCQRAATGITLTTAGERLLPHALQMAEWAGAAGQAAAAATPELEGVVRIAAPPGLAFDFLAPFAAVVRQHHPGLRVEVLASIEYLNLSRNEADIALRSETPRSKDLATLFSLKMQGAAFASRSYARRLPKKYGVADVAWIGWAPPYQHLPPNPQLAAMIPGFQPAFTSDNYLVQLAAIDAGLGAMVLTRSFHRFSQVTRFVELAIDFGPRAMIPLHVVCAKRLQAVPRIRAVIDLLRKELR